MQATYFNYYGDFGKALEHFLECGNWQKAHSIFMTSVTHSLFLSGNSFTTNMVPIVQFSYSYKIDTCNFVSCTLNCHLLSTIKVGNTMHSQKFIILLNLP